MKKTLSLLLALMLTALLALPALAEPATRTFTDSLGREVTVDQEISRIAVTGPLGQITVFAIAPEMLVGIPTAWDQTAAQYLGDRYYSLPILGQLYGGKGEMNLEALLEAAPQVVIDIGEPKQGVAEDMDALSEQTGIPFVHISAYLESLDTTYTLLGELLGKEAEAKTLADYCARTYHDTLALLDGVELANVLYITGEEGLNVLAKGSYHMEIMDKMMNNLAVVDAPTSRGTGNEVDMEQLLTWNPDIIIFSQDSIYDTVGDDPLWQEITAIKNGTYYEVPYGPHNWLTMPPSVQRLLGMRWMAKLLYPQVATYDLYEEVAEYYKLFYHCELTQAQYDALVANSIGR